MSDKYYLGFDAGTQSVKVAVYDDEQHCLAMDTAKTHLAYPQPGWVQMDVDEYYRLIKQCMASCSRQMEEKGWDVGNVRAIMGDGIICGIAFLEESFYTSEAVGGALIIAGVYLTTQYRLLAYKLARYLVKRRRQKSLNDC